MKYRLSDDFVIRNILDECIVVPKKNQENDEHGFYALNMTGKIIINGINEGKEIDDIVAEVCDAFEIDSGSAAADIDEFINAFKNMGIIQE